MPGSDLGRRGAFFPAGEDKRTTGTNKPDTAWPTPPGIARRTRAPLPIRRSTRFAETGRHRLELASAYAGSRSFRTRLALRRGHVVERCLGKQVFPLKASQILQSKVGSPASHHERIWIPPPGRSADILVRSSVQRLTWFGKQEDLCR